MMFSYNPVGKTLQEVHKECGWNRGGYEVFVLQDETDENGIRLDVDFSVGLILQRHPEYKNCRVKYENDFYGTTVLRIEGGSNSPSPNCSKDIREEIKKNESICSK